MEQFTAATAAGKLGGWVTGDGEMVVATHQEEHSMGRLPVAC